MLQDAANVGRRDCRIGSAEPSSSCKRPDRMDRRRVQPGRVGRPILDQLREVGRRRPSCPARPAASGRAAARTCCRSSSAATSPFGSSFDSFGRSLGLPSLRDDPIDAAVRLVAQRGLVRGPLAGLVPLGRRVVLDDEVVPVDHPDVARPGRPRPGSARSTRRRWPRGSRRCASGSPCRRGCSVKVATRCPVGSATKAVRFQYCFGIGARRVERRAGAGGEPAVPVDLADVLGDREEAVRVGDVRQHRWGHAADRLVVAVRDRHVDARAAVGGRAEEQALLADADAPRVVVRAAEELQLRAVGLEPEEALAEVVPLAADLAGEAGVADDRVDPVVEPVPQVRRPGVGVARAEPGEERLALVGLAVAVGVLQEEHVRGLRHDQAAVDVAEARRDAQILGEDGLLVGLAVAVGVLDDRDPVAALALRLHLVRVVDRLGDVEAAEVVPGHRDRLADLRLGDEQLGLEPRRASRGA